MRNKGLLPPFLLGEKVFCAIRTEAKMQQCKQCRRFYSEAQAVDDLGVCQECLLDQNVNELRELALCPVLADYFKESIPRTTLLDGELARN